MLPTWTSRDTADTVKFIVFLLAPPCLASKWRMKKDAVIQLGLDQNPQDMSMGYLYLPLIIKKKCWEGQGRVNNTHFQVSGWSQHWNNHESSLRFVPLGLTPSFFWLTVWLTQASCHSYLYTLKGQDPPRRHSPRFQNFNEGQANYCYIRSQRRTADLSVDKIAQSPVINSGDGISCPPKAIFIAQRLLKLCQFAAHVFNIYSFFLFFGL